MPIAGEDALGSFRGAGYRLLALEPEHALATESLSMHHQGPFERLLAAEAQTGPVRLVTQDPLLARYGDFAFPSDPLVPR
jgi:PIN domain nuclease of toxin-antitoxin system